MFYDKLKSKEESFMYIPLYVKSNYSLLSSMLKIDDIISYSVTKKIPYAVISDTITY